MAASAEPDEARRRALYLQVQQILAEDLPSISLWYPDNVILHSPRLTNVTLNPGGNFDFLLKAELK
jgi:peptide/nickel transport system substrate-binding protein